MDNEIINYGYNGYAEYLDVDDKIKYLKTVKANLFVTTYIKTLISNLYIDIRNEKRGYASEMIHNNALTNYSYEATSIIVPFLKDNALLYRGYLRDDYSNKVAHSWIAFNIHGKDYIFDPALDIMTSKESYDGIFLPEVYGKINGMCVKNDLITILNEGKKTNDGFRIIDESNDINSSFYKTNMQVNGTVVNKKILMLTSRINRK